MSLISFKSDRIISEWAHQTDERLKFVLRSMAVLMDGLRITCLVRTPEENQAVGGMPNSKHLIDLTDKCCAADVNPPFEEIEPDYWRERFKAFINAHLIGVDVVVHEGTAKHVHLEIDTKMIPDGQVRLI